ncbi:MAG TPA: hypothetical protein PKB14_12215 [Rubrivivax sp.]|nr:hypothetical protein [Rubrivivax sp.]
MIDPELKEILAAIRKRPGMYFGRSEELLSCIYGFINGYCYAREKSSAFLIQANKGDEKFFPSKSFVRYLQVKHDYPGGIGWNWKSLVASRHGLNEQGFDVFFGYLDDFLNSKS